MWWDMSVCPQIRMGEHCQCLGSQQKSGCYFNVWCAWFMRTPLILISWCCLALHLRPNLSIAVFPNALEERGCPVVLQSRKQVAVLPEAHKKHFPAVRGSASITAWKREGGIKSSPRRDCALRGAKISAFAIRNVSKQ